MKIKINKTNITVTGITNGSQLDDVLGIARVSGCKTKLEDASTKVVIVGDLDTFIKKWDDE